MDDKDIKKIAYQIRNEVISADEAHEWLASASVDKLKEYLRWMPIGSPWSQHGRDALNILLANENIQLQKDIKDMTKKMETMTTVITWLTVFIAILTLIQATPIIKSFINSHTNVSKTSTNIQQNEKAINQSEETNQIQNSNSQLLEKSKTNK